MQYEEKAMCRPAVRRTIDLNDARFFVGRDRLGHWIVRDRDGMIGGTFIERRAAMHFAMVESDYRNGAVCCLPDTVMINGDPTPEQPPTHLPC